METKWWCIWRRLFCRAPVVAVMAIVGVGAIGAVGATPASAQQTPDVICRQNTLTGADSTVQQIGRLYRGTFDRTPDQRGWAYWEGRSEFWRTPLVEVARAFVDSPEFRNKYGNLNNSQFVDRLYRNVLDRRPDAGGLAYWSDLLNRGLLSRPSLMVQLTESVEFKTKMDIEFECVAPPPDIGSWPSRRYWFAVDATEVRHHPGSGITRRYQKARLPWHVPSAALLGAPVHIFRGSATISKSCSASGAGSHFGFAGYSPAYDETTTSYDNSAIVLCFTGSASGRVALHEAVHLWQLLATGHAHYSTDEYLADCVVLAMTGQSGDYRIPTGFCGNNATTVNRYVGALTTGRL